MILCISQLKDSWTKKMYWNNSVATSNSKGHWNDFLKMHKNGRSEDNFYQKLRPDSEKLFSYYINQSITIFMTVFPNQVWNSFSNTWLKVHKKILADSIVPVWKNILNGSVARSANCKSHWINFYVNIIVLILLC